MNAKEVEQLVELIYGNWNDRLPSAAPVRKTVLAPWHRALSSLSYEEALAAVDALSLSDTYMPRPGLVRKKAMSSRLQPPPGHAFAWAQVQALGRAVNTGTYSEGSCHPCVLETVQAMGGISSLSVSTNGDRSFFLEAYQEVVAKWEALHYGMDN